MDANQNQQLHPQGSRIPTQNQNIPEATPNPQFDPQEQGGSALNQNMANPSQGPHGPPEGYQQNVQPGNQDGITQDAHNDHPMDLDHDQDLGNNPDNNEDQDMDRPPQENDPTGAPEGNEPDLRADPGSLDAQPHQEPEVNQENQGAGDRQPEDNQEDESDDETTQAGTERGRDLEGNNRTILSEIAILQDLQIPLTFAKDLETASLDNGTLDKETPARLRNPTQQPLPDQDLLVSIKLYFATDGTSQETYSNVREVFLESHPEDSILTFHQIKKRVEELSGVVILEDDMCPKSCIAYTGTAYKDLEICPKCGEGRWDPVVLAASNGTKKVAQQKYCSIALGPVVQSMYQSLKGCEEMDYLYETMKGIFRNEDPAIESYNDFCFGSDIVEAFARGDIQRHDVLLMFSIDGAQLYKGKKV